jgi:hypothetical protein
MPKLRASIRPETVPVPRPTLARRGWKRVIAAAPEPESFGRLLKELRAERSVHSWRWMAARGGLRGLLAEEARRRPGTVYAYYAVRRDGARELVGAAALAERVRAGFPHAGFPVAARGFVRPRFRGAGLYEPLLAHRVAVCRRVWGAALDGIHLGSANPRVWRSARRGTGGAVFLPIGAESLPAGRGRRRVRDFLYFSPAFARRLRAECADTPLASPVARMLRRGLPPRGHAALRAAWEAAGRPSRALGRLLDLFAAIPLSPAGR